MGVDFYCNLFSRHVYLTINETFPKRVIPAVIKPRGAARRVGFAELQPARAIPVNEGINNSGLPGGSVPKE